MHNILALQGVGVTIVFNFRSVSLSVSLISSASYKKLLDRLQFN